MGSLITRPSSTGVMPIGEAWMARQMDCTLLTSNGSIFSVLGSGTVMLAKLLMGVMAP